MLRGYTIPVLDLADDIFRQSVVDREEGQYLGHPTTVLLDDASARLGFWHVPRHKRQVCYSPRGRS